MRDAILWTYGNWSNDSAAAAAKKTHSYLLKVQSYISRHQAAILNTLEAQRFRACIADRTRSRSRVSSSSVLCGVYPRGDVAAAGPPAHLRGAADPRPDRRFPARRWHVLIGVRKIRRSARRPDPDRFAVVFSGIAGRVRWLAFAIPVRDVALIAVDTVRDSRGYRFEVTCSLTWFFTRPLVHDGDEPRRPGRAGSSGRPGVACLISAVSAQGQEPNGRTIPSPAGNEILKWLTVGGSGSIMNSNGKAMTCGTAARSRLPFGQELKKAEG